MYLKLLQPPPQLISYSSHKSRGSSAQTAVRSPANQFMTAGRQICFHLNQQTLDRETFADGLSALLMKASWRASRSTSSPRPGLATPRWGRILSFFMAELGQEERRSWVPQRQRPRRSAFGGMWETVRYWAAKTLSSVYLNKNRAAFAVVLLAMLRSVFTVRHGRIAVAFEGGHVAEVGDPADRCVLGVVDGEPTWLERIMCVCGMLCLRPPTGSQPKRSSSHARALGRATGAGALS